MFNLNTAGLPTTGLVKSVYGEAVYFFLAGDDLQQREWTFCSSVMGQEAEGLGGAISVWVLVKLRFVPFRIWPPAPLSSSTIVWWKIETGIKTGFAVLAKIVGMAGVKLSSSGFDVRVLQIWMKQGRVEIRK
jgi:hypothetical protein